jgi:hypothetical protein
MAQQMALRGNAHRINSFTNRGAQRLVAPLVSILSGNKGDQLCECDAVLQLYQSLPGQCVRLSFSQISRASRSRASRLAVSAVLAEPPARTASPEPVDPVPQVPNGKHKCLCRYSDDDVLNYSYAGTDASRG